MRALAPHQSQKKKERSDACPAGFSSVKCLGAVADTGHGTTPPMSKCSQTTGECPVGIAGKMILPPTSALGNPPKNDPPIPRILDLDGSSRCNLPWENGSDRLAKRGEYCPESGIGGLPKTKAPRAAEKKVTPPFEASTKHPKMKPRSYCCAVDFHSNLPPLPSMGC